MEANLRRNNAWHLMYFTLAIILFLVPFEIKMLIPALVLIPAFLLSEPISILVKRAIKNPFLWLCWAFFAFHAISLLWTENIETGMAILETKLSYAIVTFIVCGATLSPEQIIRLFKISLFGLICSMLINSVWSLIIFANTGDYLKLYYSEFSKFMHVAYVSMHLNFALVFLLWLLFNKKSLLFKNSKADIYVSLGIVLFYQFLVANKTGIAISLILLFISLTYYFINQRKITYLILSWLFIFSLPILSYKLIPGFGNRIEQTIKELKGEELAVNDAQSVNIRKQIWKEASLLLIESPLTGYGAGDVNDLLYQKYVEDDIFYGKKEKLNAHNQFLQTSVGMGIIGFVILFVIMLTPIAPYFYKVNILNISFVLIIFLFCFTESIFERQAGNLFFTLFGSLLTLLFSKKTEKI